MVETTIDRELRARGYRVTGPRRAVWEALEQADGHITVEQVARLLSDAGAEVDLASVYRTLALFEELGLARVTRLGDGEAGRWEVAHPDEHFHLVCTRCGDVDHHIGSLVSRITAHLEDGHGFEVAGIDLVVTGLCQSCRAAGDRPDRMAPP